jgi:hypothetical protein
MSLDELLKRSFVAGKVLLYQLLIGLQVCAHRLVFFVNKYRQDVTRLFHEGMLGVRDVGFVKKILYDAPGLKS